MENLRPMEALTTKMPQDGTSARTLACLSMCIKPTDTETMSTKMMRMTQKKTTIMSPAMAAKATKMRKRKMRLYPLNTGTSLLDMLTMILDVRVKKR